MNMAELRPKERSELRIKLGKTFYTWKRYFEWLIDGNNYANERDRVLLPHSAFGHQTPLIRKLQGVDISYQQNKITNLKLAVEKINGIIIKPGETFSYWKLIGSPTKRKGYVDGMVLHYGRFMKGIGGGLCQLSNLIYWMTLHTPLTVTERHRHSFDVFPDSNRTQPFGSGATCSYNYLDLRIKNETDVPYQLHVRLTDTHLVGEWRCEEPQLYVYHIFEKDHSILPAYWGGYIRHNELWRKAYNRQHKLVSEEFITENNAIMMYEPLLEQKVK
ncbi:vancomycin resistance protein [Bacillus sp. FJAT-27225]|uniref:VanW family protein n=1 Tax=Bacillus sp. FJAT-27225 TaxID=1743144 RepID=UPI00080C316B|nr:VanW family protein [Bacillus sp. FJAT-27225]OCA82990.1 vancomycin resistance protein [Bacillus sp. FJAT-27225]